MLIVRFLRMARGETLFDLAVRTGILPGRLSVIERNPVGASAHELEAIASALDFPQEQVQTLAKPVDWKRVLEAAIGQ